MMLIDVKFNIGDFVYLKTDIDQMKRLVTGLTIRVNTIVYHLTLETTESTHYDFEITAEADIMMTSTN